MPFGNSHELRRLRGLESVDARDVVADLDDGPDFGLRRAPVLKVGDLLLEDPGDFVCVDHGSSLLV